MNRRHLLRHATALLSPKDEGDKDQPKSPGEPNPLANKTLPKTLRSRAGLQPYTGTFGFKEAAHLLRRTTIGPTLQEISDSVRDGLPSTLTTLLTEGPLPAPPLNDREDDDQYVAIGQTWITAGTKDTSTGYRKRSLQAWQIGLFLDSGRSIREKMVLFWHNHFAIEFGVVGDARYVYQYLELIRQQALGNFKTLAEEMTVNPAMLKYLNGNQNLNSRPNENYARELFELFTIGKGPQIGPGNYTHYTEEDVVAAARVLTGWRDRNNSEGGAPGREFRASKHDTDDKTFTSAFENHLISDNGQDEYKDLIAMIFDQDETARHLARSLYRWFVYYVIDEDTEQQVIEPMAQEIINSQYDIKPALRRLLESEHFFDQLNQGCMIKNPIEFSLSIIRQFEVVLPDASDLETQYEMWIYLFNQANNQLMRVFDPPSVAGWTAYYQEPQFFQIWINSTTMPARKSLSDRLLGNGYTRNGFKMVVDPLPFISQFSDPLDPNVLIEEAAQLLFTHPIEESQRDFLKEVLIPGLPDFEWSMEYGDYLADPNDEDKRTAVSKKLNSMFATMLEMAEAHLM